VLSKWAAAVKRQGKVRSKGAPSIFTLDDKLKIRQLTKTGKYRVTDEEFQEGAHKFAKNRAIRDNRVYRAPSKRTLARVESEMGIKTGYAEETTDARANAIAYARNAVTFIALNDYLSSSIVPALIVNGDATQFTVGKDPRKKNKVKFVIEDVADGPLKTSSKKKTKGGLLYSIKYYLIISAAGVQSSSVFIVADENMPEGEIEGRFDVFLSFFTEHRTKFFSEIEMFSEEMDVDLSEDEGKSNKKGRGKLRGQSDKPRAKKKTMPTQHVNVACYGLLRILFALQSAIKPQTILTSFMKCGMVPFDQDYIYNSFNVPFTAEERESVSTHLPELKSLLMTNGEIKDEDLDALGLFPHHQEKER
jgi:hypothetical protein